MVPHTPQTNEIISSKNIHRCTLNDFTKQPNSNNINDKIPRNSLFLPIDNLLQ